MSVLKGLKMNIKYAPWSPEEVKNLEKWQTDPRLKKARFICTSCRKCLKPTKDGWYCVNTACGLCDTIVKDWEQKSLLSGVMFEQWDKGVSS